MSLPGFYLEAERNAVALLRAANRQDVLGATEATLSLTSDEKDLLIAYLVGAYRQALLDVVGGDPDHLDRVLGSIGNR